MFLAFLTDPTFFFQQVTLICTSTRLPTYPSTHPSIHAFNCSSIHLPHHLFIHPSTIYPSTITLLYPSAVLSPTTHHQSIGHHVTYPCMHPSIHIYVQSFIHAVTKGILYVRPMLGAENQTVPALQVCTVSQWIRHSHK